MQLPVTVLNASTKRESGKKAQFGNIAAAKVREFFPFFPVGFGARTRPGLSLRALRPGRRRAPAVYYTLTHPRCLRASQAAENVVGRRSRKKKGGGGAPGFQSALCPSLFLSRTPPTLSPRSTHTGRRRHHPHDPRPALHAQDAPRRQRRCAVFFAFCLVPLCARRPPRSPPPPPSGPRLRFRCEQREKQAPHTHPPPLPHTRP